MLEISNLHKSYPIGDSSLHVLKGINLSVKEGEMVAIMGSSGSGKSTLLNIIGMLDEVDFGSYVLDGLPIKNLTEKKAVLYRNKFLGFIFQFFNLINYKTDLEHYGSPKRQFYSLLGFQKKNLPRASKWDSKNLLFQRHEIPNQPDSFRLIHWAFFDHNSLREA